MMRATLSTPTISTSVVVLDLLASSDTWGMTRRVTRTATLDGGVVVVDGGYSAGDRTLTLLARVDLDTLRDLEALASAYPLVVVAVDSGCYEAAISAITYSDGVVTVTALVKADMTEA